MKWIDSFPPSLEGYVVVYDSGIGGLTVLKALEKIRPDLSFFYFGDNAFFPYGTKSLKTLQSRAKELFDLFFSLGALAVVIACHTLSTQLAHLFPQGPLFWTIEGSYKALLSLHSPASITLLATEGTLKSGLYQSMVQTIHPGVFLRVQSATLLIENIERSHNLQYFFDGKEDEVLFLGSTHLPHYPFHGKKLCDPTPFIAESVAQRLSLEKEKKETILRFSSPESTKMLTVLRSLCKMTSS